MSAILSVVLGVAVLILALIARKAQFSPKKVPAPLKVLAWFGAIGAGLCNFFVTTAPLWVVITMFAMFSIAMVTLCVWFVRSQGWVNGRRLFVGLVMVIGVAIIGYVLSRDQAANLVYLLKPEAFWESVLLTVPTAVFAVVIVVLVARFLKGIWPKRSNLFRTLAVLATVIALGLTLGFGVNWGAFKPSQYTGSFRLQQPATTTATTTTTASTPTVVEPTAEPTTAEKVEEQTPSQQQTPKQTTTATTPEPVKAEEEKDEPAKMGTMEQRWTTYAKLVDRYPFFVFHNFYLQGDGIADNNLNFGSDRYNPDWTSQDYWKDCRENFLGKDPFVLVPIIAAVDKARHTDLCGSYYNGSDTDWAIVMNDRIKEFLADPALFVRTNEVFNDFCSYELLNMQLSYLTDIRDQVYINPYTMDGIPELVVCETHQEGWVLFLTFRLKGEDSFTIGLRVNCGYQLIAVEETLGIEPIPELPEVPEYTPDPTPAPEPEPTPTPEPEPETPDNPVKEPSLLVPVNTEPNDDLSAGPETLPEPGEDPNISSVDTEDSSTSYESYEAYDAAVFETEAIDVIQGVGEDPNIPSTPTPEPVSLEPGGEVFQPTVDNDTEGLIDNSTSVTPPAVTAGGEATNIEAGGAWGGLPD